MGGNRGIAAKFGFKIGASYGMARLAFDISGRALAVLLRASSSQNMMDFDSLAKLEKSGPRKFIA